MDELVVHVGRFGAWDDVVEGAANVRKRRAGTGPRSATRELLHLAVVFAGVPVATGGETSVANLLPVAVVARLRADNSAGFAEVRTAAVVAPEGGAATTCVSCGVEALCAGPARATAVVAARLARVRDGLDAVGAANVYDAEHVPALVAEVLGAPRDAEAKGVARVVAPRRRRCRRRARQRAVAHPALSLPHQLNVGARRGGRPARAIARILVFVAVVGGVDRSLGVCKKKKEKKKKKKKKVRRLKRE